MSSTKPLIVGIGGALHTGSTTELALRHALRFTGAHTTLFTGADLDLPLFAAQRPQRTPAVNRLLDALREADGVILATPGYHGGMSGLVKNALDYTEFLRDDARPYLSERAVGCICNAAGWQGAVTTLTATRSIVHALRGWPTPLGVCVVGPEKAFDGHGECLQVSVDQQLQLLAGEVSEFAHWRASTRRAVPESRAA